MNGPITSVVQALDRIEAAVDKHKLLKRPDSVLGGSPEVAFDRDGWTIRCPLKRRDARAYKRWHPTSTSADTLDAAVRAFEQGLDVWAEVLK